MLCGRVLTGLGAAMLLFSGAVKLAAPQPVLDSMVELGWPTSATTGLGLLELGCTLLYLWPRTSRLGIVLVTGYLGGAVATHLRRLDPWLSHTLFPVWLGAALWLALLLRDAELRTVMLAPFRRRRGRS